jgi:hypothetical protein
MLTYFLFPFGVGGAFSILVGILPFCLGQLNEAKYTYKIIEK